MLCITLQLVDIQASRAPIEGYNWFFIGQIWRQRCSSEWVSVMFVRGSRLKIFTLQGYYSHCLSHLHLVFHVSQLKRRVGPAVVTHRQPPSCDTDGQIMIQPLAILQRKWSRSKMGSTWRFWFSGLTWVWKKRHGTIGVISRIDFQNLWLNRNLEDKVIFKGEGIVRVWNFTRYKMGK